MADRTLYEEVSCMQTTEPRCNRCEEGWVAICDGSVLVKVEPCKHGNYAPHIVNPTLEIDLWCDGKPEDDDG